MRPLPPPFFFPFFPSSEIEARDFNYQIEFESPHLTQSQLRDLRGGEPQFASPLIFRARLACGVANQPGSR